MATNTCFFIYECHHLFDTITPHITGSKKQSEAALFTVRVHVIVISFC
jgi:hypothetical protein